MRGLTLSLALLAPTLAGAWPKIFAPPPPVVEQHQVTIELAYPGAAPDVIERTIAAPVERALRGLPDVERVESRAVGGVAKLTLDLRAGAEGQAVLLAVRDRLGALRDLPADSEAPIIRLVQRTAEVVTLRIRDASRPGPPPPALVDRLQRRLVEVPHVFSVEREAPTAPTIDVQVDEDRATRFGLTAADVARQIRAAGALNDVEALRNLELATPAGLRLPLSSVAVLARVAPSPSPVPEDAVDLHVNRAASTPIEEIRAAIRKAVGDFELPVGAVIEWIEPPTP